MTAPRKPTIARLISTRPPAGRPRRPPTTPDAKLIARACEASGLTMRELAIRLGCAATMLSAANGRQALSEARRAQLRGMLE